MLKDPEIQNCLIRKDTDDQLIRETLSSKSDMPSTSTAQNGQLANGNENSLDVPDDISKFYERMERDDDDAEDVQIVSFEVNQSQIEVLQRRCIQLEYPLLAEYDFRNDTINPDIK